MTEREALKLALEALNATESDCGGRAFEREQEAITAIKEVLAQPQPWEKFCDSNCVWTDHHPDCKLAERKPLSDEEIRRANHHMVEGAYDYSFKQGVKWAEYKHGIKVEA